LLPSYCSPRLFCSATSGTVQAGWRPEWWRMPHSMPPCSSSFWCRPFDSADSCDARRVIGYWSPLQQVRLAGAVRVRCGSGAVFAPAASPCSFFGWRIVRGALGAARSHVAIAVSSSEIARSSCTGMRTPLKPPLGPPAPWAQAAHPYLRTYGQSGTVPRTQLELIG